MAVTNPFLRGVVNGFLGSPNLKDYKHASKTFTTADFGNAPKFKWLFHVYFDFNRIASNNYQAFGSTINEGLLVKNIDLPKFNFSLAEMNQYNRKRWVQTKINYDPVKITFHDDNANQIRHMWHAYYSYYYNDTNQPLSRGTSSINTPASVDIDSALLNVKNTYSENISSEKDYGYYGEYDNAGTGVLNGKAPFFKTIRIYGFNQHNFAEYVLINPIIETFSHDQYDYYTSNGIMEHQMTVRFENVKYYEGNFNGLNPETVIKGFANGSVYDKETSPIMRPGNNKTILGPGGLLDAGNGIVRDLSTGNYLGALLKAGRVSRTFRNPQEILQTAKTEILQGVIGAINDPRNSRNIFTFPTPGGQNNTNSQAVNATNTTPSQPEPIPVEPLNPIQGP